MSKKVTASEVKAFLLMAIELLSTEEDIGIDSKIDQYWTILSIEQFDFSKIPEPGVGSLDDDIGHLRRCINDRSYFSIIDLEKIASILKSINASF